MTDDAHLDHGDEPITLAEILACRPVSGKLVMPGQRVPRDSRPLRHDALVDFVADHPLDLSWLTEGAG